MTSNLSKQQVRFYVEVEGRETRPFDSAEEAMGWATRQVYLNPERADDAQRLLELGQVFMYSYGFEGVNIIPKVVT